MSSKPIAYSLDAYSTAPIYGKGGADDRIAALSKRTLILIRHAKCVKRKAWTGVEEMRPLTPRGVEEFEDIAERLAKVHSPGVILHSPLVRTKQTADILGDVADVAVQPCAALSPLNGIFAATAGILDCAGPTRTIAVVAHSDLLNALSGELGVKTELPRGGVIVLRGRKVVWSADPKDE